MSARLLNENRPTLANVKFSDRHTAVRKIFYHVHQLQFPPSFIVLASDSSYYIYAVFLDSYIIQNNTTARLAQSVARETLKLSSDIGDLKVVGSSMF
jgi:hypothetical protein